MKDYNVGDIISHRKTDGSIAVGLVYEKQKSYCFVKQPVPSQTTAIQVMVWNQDIVRVEPSN